MAVVVRSVVVGVDAGGTASKAVVVDETGAVLGRGSAGPGNPAAGGPAAARAIGSALRAALGPAPATVTSGVVGVAGASALADPAIAAAFAAEWDALGLRCPMTIAGDAVTAFAAGGDWASGAVLIAGTGAVAALVEGLEITRVADGLGWLLGDEGSGMWLGLQAVRLAARQWQAPLARRVAAHAGAATADDLVHWAQALPPFGALAPVVCELADAGDPDASAITTEAARRLVATLDELEAPDAPVVLAGGLLVADTPVRRGVLARLAERGVVHGTTVGTAHDPALGAARLALRTGSGSPAPAAPPR
ncbi:BadF/BadG/BcrA/BcrD ATPase family protein [Dactylosporangium sp. NPDC000244]|uniref:N-acetylglucosamine kinase n=1 Tax=Dactylosporangium sp. NPDC000244 TaxID=3154365 RepID=UPI0033230FEC|nr:BadF/BadG/BcrA/BcrD ATPase family protein [Dactylosporangium thailandense]